MSTRVFVARLAGCAVFDPNGDRVGRIRDVLVVRRNLQAPRVVGFDPFARLADFLKAETR